MNADGLTLAVDIGSSSVRAMLFDATGARIPDIVAQTRYPSITTPDGGVMIDPETLTQTVDSCIDSALEQAGGAPVVRVAMDSLVGNLLGLDAHGQPVTPIYTWADNRGADLGEWLKGQLDAQDYTRRAGCRIHTSYWPVRLLWLRANEPDLFGRVRWWVTLGDYLLYRLFGTRRISLSAASWSGLLDRHRLRWDDATIAHLPIEVDQLSELSDGPFTGLGGEWAARWPALKSADWHPAIGDGVASNVGAGCIEPGHVAISVGTSGAMRVIVGGTPARTPDGLFVYRVDAQRSLVGGALSNAGNLYAWLTRILHAEDDELALIGSLPPDSHGLTVLPFLAGERAPGWNNRAQAAFIGMTFDTAAVQMVRAALEAVSYRFYQIAARLRPLLPADPIYIASGAPVLNSPTWMQIMADVLGAPVYANAEPEATIRGAALLASGISPTPDLGQGYQPDMAHHGVYQAAIERQNALYRRLFAG